MKETSWEENFISNVSPIAVDIISFENRIKHSVGGMKNISFQAQNVAPCHHFMYFICQYDG